MKPVLDNYFESPQLVEPENIKPKFNAKELLFIGWMCLILGNLRYVFYVSSVTAELKILDAIQGLFGFIALVCFIKVMIISNPWRKHK